PRPISSRRPTRPRPPKISRFEACSDKMNTGLAPRIRADVRSDVIRMLAFADPDLDNGPRTDRSARSRMCAVTRQVRPIDELIRFVVSPQGEVIPDLKRKLPGRGRAAPGLAADTEALLARSAIDALAMAAKAGQVISGFGKVEDALKARQGSNRAPIQV